MIEPFCTQLHCYTGISNAKKSVCIFWKAINIGTQWNSQSLTSFCWVCRLFQLQLSLQLISQMHQNVQRNCHCIHPLLAPLSNQSTQWFKNCFPSVPRLGNAGDLRCEKLMMVMALLCVIVLLRYYAIANKLREEEGAILVLARFDKFNSFGGIPYHLTLRDKVIDRCASWLNAKEYPTRDEHDNRENKA